MMTVIVVMSVMISLYNCAGSISNYYVVPNTRN